MLASIPGLGDLVLDECLQEPETIVLEERNDALRPDSVAALVAATGNEALPVGLAHLFRQEQRDIQIEAARTGRVVVTSPTTGQDVAQDAAFCLENHGLLFRFPAPDPQDGFVGMCSGHHLTMFGVYFPARNIAVHLNAYFRAQTEQMFRERPHRGVWLHVWRFAHLLVDRPTTLAPVLLCAFDHIGHHLWNELAGFQTTLDRIGAETTPQLAIVTSDFHELYGPIDEIFPEFAPGTLRVGSLAETPALVYRENLLALRVSGIRVSRELAARVSNVARRHYMSGLTERTLRALQEKGFKIVVLGLRVENRTVVGFPAFCERLVGQLRDELGKVVVVVDGMNSADTGVAYRVTLAGAASDTVLEAEKGIAEVLTWRFADDPNVVILSTIGTAVGASVAICDKAAFFVTPWGAGLAKYRWISNLPGLVVVGPSCRRFQHVPLYNDPTFMESPEPIYFMDPEDVTDAPDDTPMLQTAAPDRVNIRVDPEKFEARLHAMIDELRQAGIV